jgi:hypothetical protein
MNSTYSADEQIAMAEQRVQLMIRTHGVDGGPTSFARADLAVRLENADKWSEARVLREEVLASRRRNLGADNQQTLWAELWLATNLARGGSYDDALPLAVHARDGFRQVDGVDQEAFQTAEEIVTWITSSTGSDLD